MRVQAQIGSANGLNVSLVPLIKTMQTKAKVRMYQSITQSIVFVIAGQEADLMPDSTASRIRFIGGNITRSGVGKSGPRACEREYTSEQKDGHCKKCACTRK